MAISFETRLVTSDDAHAWLANVHNRGKIDLRPVNAYARDMGAGRWKLNGEPIIFDGNGKLLSGRLRLHACIRAKSSFPSLIVRGVNEADFDTIDALRRRTLGDILTMRREKHGRALAAALAYVARFNQGAFDFSGSAKAISAQMLIAVLQANPSIRDSVELTRDVSPTLPHGMAGALHYLFSQRDANKASAFFQEVVEGSSDDKSPPTQLKRQMNELSERGGARSSKLMLGLTIKAWELYAAGERRQLLRFSPETENFPKITLPIKAFDQSNGSDTGTPELDEQSPNQETNTLSVRQQFISPDEAGKFLAANTGNRSIAVAVVDKYARDMRDGKWVLNGQAIKFGRSGRLLDGQHRLTAAVKANRGFPTLVVLGLDDDVFDTFDLGARRSIGDILKERGEINTSSLGAVLRQAWLLENGFAQHRTVSPTVSELLRYLDEWPDIRDSVKNANRFRGVIDPSMGCALHFFLRRAHHDKGEAFMAGLSSGAELGRDSPILKLRNRLNDDRVSRKRSMSDGEKLAICIKSWNAYFLEKPLATLKWANVGPTRESFPKIAGLERLDIIDEAA
jgi:hypothetical protein